MRTLDEQVRFVYERVLGAAQRHHKRTVGGDERRVFRAAAGAHVAREALGRAHGNDSEAAAAFDLAQLAHLGADDVVRRIHDRHGTRHACQVVEQLELRVAVVFKRMVPMQVIGRDVEHDGHVRREALRGRQLIRRHLGHVHVGRIRAHGGNARVADVADGRSAQARRLQQVRGKRGDRGFAVRAGDGNPAAACRRFAPRELDFADNFVAEARRRLIQLGEFGDARACDGELEMPACRFGQLRHGVIAERDVSARRARGLGERVGIGAVRAAEDGKFADAPSQKRHEVVHGVVAGLA